MRRIGLMAALALFLAGCAANEAGRDPFGDDWLERETPSGGLVPGQVPR